MAHATGLVNHVPCLAERAVGACLAGALCVSPRCAILAALPLSLVAGCTEVGSRIAVPADFSPPPAALLEPSRLAPPPVDPRFTDALVAFVSAVRALPSYQGADADMRIREAPRLLAHADALVPARPEIREAAYAAATELRVTAARMATDFVTDPRAQTAHARQALQATATFLLQVAAADYAESPEVLARVQAFAAAVRAIDPDPVEPERARIVAALTAAEEALEAMLGAAISAAHQLGDAGQRETSPTRVKVWSGSSR